MVSTQARIGDREVIIQELLHRGGEMWQDEKGKIWTRWAGTTTDVSFPLEKAERHVKDGILEFKDGKYVLSSQELMLFQDERIWKSVKWSAFLSFLKEDELHLFLKCAGYQPSRPGSYEIVCSTTAPHAGEPQHRTPVTSAAGRADYAFALAAEVWARLGITGRRKMMIKFYKELDRTKKKA